MKRFLILASTLALAGCSTMDLAHNQAGYEPVTPVAAMRADASNIKPVEMASPQQMRAGLAQEVVARCDALTQKVLDEKMLKTSSQHFLVLAYSKEFKEVLGNSNQNWKNYYNQIHPDSVIVEDLSRCLKMAEGLALRHYAGK